MISNNLRFTASSFLLPAGILLIIYSVGFFGIVFFNEEMIRLTPLNLLVSSAIIIWSHERVNRSFLLFLLVVYISGFAIEWAGIESGKIFGQYFYGNNLGFKLFDVPLIIGLNWAIMVYCAMNVAGLIRHRFSEKAALIFIPLCTAMLMVLADYQIEQLCQRLDFWYWKYGTPPMQNYTAWFLFSFAFAFLGERLQIPTRNKVAVALFLIQLLFFAGLRLFLH